MTGMCHHGYGSTVTPATPALGVTAAPLMALGPSTALDLARRADALGYQSPTQLRQHWIATQAGQKLAV